MGKLIYLDSGATTFPKPEEVYRKMDHFYCHYGVDPGCADYDLCIEAGIGCGRNSQTYGPPVISG